jgi:hypothetical protein
MPKPIRSLKRSGLHADDRVSFIFDMNILDLTLLRFDSLLSDIRRLEDG